MRGLNTESFFWSWKVLYSASNPGQTMDHWRVADVDWEKERHIHWGNNNSFYIEIHRLKCMISNKVDWELLVVIERWWGADRDKCLRDISWCRAIAGKADRIIAWFKKQEDAHTRLITTQDRPDA